MSFQMVLWKNKSYELNNNFLSNEIKSKIFYFNIVKTI